jgi:D-alanyl-D-alanine carboxypeptidase
MMRFRAPRALAPLLRIPLLIGHTGVSGAWLFYAPELDLYLTGTVDPLAWPAVPFQQVPRLVRQLGNADPR